MMNTLLFFQELFIRYFAQIILSFSNGSPNFN